MFKVLTFLALTGLACSIVLHVLAMTGNHVPNVAFMSAIIGIFLLAIPYTVFSFILKLEDWWSTGPMAMLRGCPLWVGIASLGVIAGAVLSGGFNHQPQTAVPIVFYSVYFASFYSLMRQPWRIKGLTCPNGHHVSYWNRFCKTCGALLPKPLADD